MLFHTVLPACVLAASTILPDLPEVKVSSDILRRFGIMDNVNEVGALTTAVDSIPLENFPALQSTEKTVLDRAHDLSPISLSRQIIAMARPFNAAKLNGLVIAHALNLFDRVATVIQDVNTQVVEGYMQMRGQSADEIEGICQFSEEITVIAIAETNQLDEDAACKQFAQKQTQSPNNLPLSEAARGKGAIMTLRVLITNSEDYTITQIMTFLHNNKLYPSHLKSYVLNKLLKEIQDYAEVYNIIRKDSRFDKFIGMPIAELEKQVMQHVNMFIEANDRR